MKTHLDYISLKSISLSNIQDKINSCEEDAKHYLETAFINVESARLAGKELIALAELKEAKLIMQSNISYKRYEETGKEISWKEFLHIDSLDS